MNDAGMADETGVEAGTSEPPITFRHMIRHQYTSLDGLPGMQVEDICQDRQGGLWIATADGGVCRFDGVHFDRFGSSDGLPNENVTSIAEDADGRLLFGTLGGLAVFDGGKFEAHTTGQGLPCNEILGLKPLKDGSTWLLTRKGIARFAGDECVEAATELAGRPLGPVYDLATAAGTTWLATRERGVVNLEGEPMEGDLGSGKGAMQWPWKFALDAAGRLWIAFRYQRTDAVVGRYDPGRGRLELVKADSGVDAAVPAAHGTRHVRIDRRGWLWMARRGVLVYDGRDWRPFSPRLEEGRLADARVTFEDREGNIWVGLGGGGLLFCDPLSVELYTEEEGLPDQEVRCLGETGEGRLWIGTPGGLACRENGRIQARGPRRAVSALAGDGEAVWSAGPDGLVMEWRGEGGKARTVRVAGADSSEEVTALAADASGRVWAGTSGGRVGRIENGCFSELAGPLPGPCSALLAAADGALWAGAGGGAAGLYRSEGDRLQALDADGMEAVSEVSALCEYEGRLWVGTTDHGLFSVDLRSLEVRRFSAEERHLSVNGILALEPDPRQRCLWIGTAGGGAVKYDGEVFQRIRLGDAALENVVAAVRRDRRNRLWFGTHAGLVAYHPGRTPPGLVVREAEAGRLFKAPRNIQCPENTEDIEIRFQGISFRTGGAQIRYRHRLAGYRPEEKWSGFDAAAAVSYSRLPVGRYDFEVQAIDRDGLMSEAVGVNLVVAGEGGTRLQRSAQSIISRSPAMASVLEQAGKVADAELPVLILGETGVGKGLLAERIHQLSWRRDRPLVQANCAGMTAGLVESQLFGHERGAFTGALEKRIGWFEQADRGTLFLDEVADLSGEAQGSLLIILENGLLTRLGSDKPIEVDVRVIAATNRDLGQAVKEGEFREDLYYRLSAFMLEIPPLRERRDEILLLAEHFAGRYAGKLKRPQPEFSGDARKYLTSRDWPGNVRELMHLVEGSVVSCENGVIQVEDLVRDDHAPASGSGEEAGAEAGEDPDSLAALLAALLEESGQGADKLAAIERKVILHALKAAKGKVSGAGGAADRLGMKVQRLRSRMRVHKLKRLA